MSSTSYTEFNADMFLCNNFDNKSSSVYLKDNHILSTPTSLTNATFFNLTEIKKNTDLQPHHKESLKKIINPTNPALTYDISSVVYDYLKNNKKSYHEFQSNSNGDAEWIYTFGQLVKYTSKKSFDESTNTINLDTDSTYI